MTAPSLQGAPAEQPSPAHRGARLSTAAAAGSGHVALAALAAAQATSIDQPEQLVAAQVPPELDQFFDELAGLLTSHLTSYQREKLQTSLIGAIDARFASLLGQL